MDEEGGKEKETGDLLQLLLLLKLRIGLSIACDSQALRVRMGGEREGAKTTKWDGEGREGLPGFARAAAAAAKHARRAAWRTRNTAAEQEQEEGGFKPSWEPLAPLLGTFLGHLGVISGGFTRWRRQSEKEQFTDFLEVFQRFGPLRGGAPRPLGAALRPSSGFLEA